MDECLKKESAAQFQRTFECDPLSNKKASFKLEDDALRTKNNWSASSEAAAV